MNVLRISERDYSADEKGVFTVPWSSLGDFTLRQVPPHATVELSDLPESSDFSFSIRLMNPSDAGSHEFTSVWGAVGVNNTPSVDQSFSRLVRSFVSRIERGELPDPLMYPLKVDGQTWKGATFIMDCTSGPDTLVAELIRPLLGLFHELVGPNGRVFICHASEDKAIALELAAFLSGQGIGVWLDQWEIKIGDSIVEKISVGIEASSHLVVLISRHSATKRWVVKELSAALVRQLADRSVTVLPIRLDDSPPPALLADVRYADCRRDRSRAFREVLSAISSGNST